MAELSSMVFPRPCEIPDKAAGVWQIPDLNVIIPVYNSNYKNIQQIIDDENSAAMSRWASAYDIGDHCGSLSSNGKGKWRMDEVRPGMIGFFVKKAGTTRYVCQMSAIADVKPWGYICYNQLITPRSSKDILNSCCVGKDSSRNYIALFKYDGKMP